MNDEPRNLQEEIGQRKPFELPEQEVYLNLLRTHEAISLEFDRLFKSFGLSQPLYNTLRIVGARGEEGIRSQQIASHMVRREPDVTRLVDRLEKAGLVERVRCPKDRRVIWVRATAQGQGRLKELHQPVLDLHAKQFKHIDREKLELLNQLLFEARHPDRAS